MKKVIILVGLIGAFALKAETYQRVPVTGILPVENMYAAFEILTPKYEKVILDCQSFVNGMNFYQNSKIVRGIKMVDYSTCGNVYDFISQSNQDKKAVCLEIEEETNTLNLLNEEASDCQ